MKTNTTALQVIPTNIGAVQNLNLRTGVKLDQDGNRYADAETKYNFLRDCLAQGIRSGNLQLITTVNQCSDLIARLNAAALACGKPELTAEEIAAECKPYYAAEDEHMFRQALYGRMEKGQNTRTWRGSVAQAEVAALSVEEVKARIGRPAVLLAMRGAIFNRCNHLPISAPVGQAGWNRDILAAQARVRTMSAAEVEAAFNA